MTITSVQTILPTRFTSNSTEKPAAKPPPELYHAQDFPFKGYQAPQTDGFERSKAHPDTSAIVIDNGESALDQKFTWIYRLSLSIRCPSRQGRLVL